MLNRRDLIKATALLPVLATVGCEKKPELPYLSSRAVILAFGDSLTEGYGADEGQSYPDFLESFSGREVINAGISGEESSEGLERLPETLDEYEPDLMVLCHGGNEILRGRSETKMESNLRAMISLATSRSIPVLMLGVPDRGIMLSPAEVYQNIADSTEVVYIDDLVSDVLSDDDLKSDLVHPNSRGYETMARRINDVLTEAGAI